MKFYQKEFLDHMNAAVKRDDAFTIEVHRYYTDVNGVLLNKNAVANNLKVSLPFYLFNKFDKDGGYRVAQYIMPPQSPLVYLYYFVISHSFNWFQFTGQNTVLQFMHPGDAVILFADDPVNFNTLVWLHISCPYQAYASILDHIHTRGRIEVYKILYNVDSLTNYHEAIHIYNINEIGVYHDMQIQPLSMKTTETKYTDFVELPLKYKFSNFAGFMTNFQFNSEVLRFNFLIKI